MSDGADGASAPAEGAAIPVDKGAQLQPLGSQTPVAEKPDAPQPEPKGKEPAAKADDDKPSKSAGDAVKRAFAKIEADKAAAVKDGLAKDAPSKDGDKTAAKPEGKQETKPAGDKADADKPQQARGEGGRFAKPPSYLKTQEERDDYVSWSDTAKSVSARREQEFEAGIASHRTETERAKAETERHRAGAEAFEGYRELDDIAKQHGRKGADVFREYYQMEQMLQKDLVGGLDNICQRVGYSLRDVAAHVMGQKPEQVQSQNDATIRELKQTISQLQQQIGGVTQSIQQERQQTTLTEVTKFAQEHPRFEELAEDIAFFMKSGRAKDLPDAYDLAERLNPDPGQPSKRPNASSASADPPPSLHTDKGTKSITGAPTDGLEPSQGKPASSNREALQRAFRRKGII